MDYGNYDALGNKIRENSNDNAASTTTATTAVEVVDDRNRADPKKTKDHGKDESDWSDVEIIDQHDSTDDITVPLVQSSGYNINLLSATEATGSAAEILLLTNNPSAATTNATSGAAASKSESQKHAHAINFIVGAASKMRNVAIVGDIHSGKSSIARLLSSSAAEVEGQFDELTTGKTAKQRHFGTSATPKAAAASALIAFQALTEQEHDRLTTLRSHTYSCLVSGQKTQTTHLVTITDTPGHPSFITDTLSSVRIADTVLLCVDASASLGSHAEQIIRRAVLQNIRIVLVLTKLDRLIADLHMPPNDAYAKMRTIIDSVNNVIASCGLVGSSEDSSASVCPLVSPINNTVWFTSAKMNFFFTLETFAAKYSEVYRNIDVRTLAPRLWGPIRYDPVAKKFTKITSGIQRPSFVTLILEPLYKVISHSVGGEGFSALNDMLSECPKSPWAAVREASTLYFGSFHKSAVDALLFACEAPQRRNRVLKTQYQVEVDDEGAPIRCAAAVATGVLIVPAAGGSGSDSANAAGPSPQQKPEVAGNRMEQAADETMFVLVRVVNSVVKKGDSIVIVEHRASADAHTTTAVIEGLFVRTVVGLVEIPDAISGMTVYVKGIASKMAGPHGLLVADQSEQSFPIPTVPSVFGGLSVPPSLLRLPSSATDNNKGRTTTRKDSIVPSSALDKPLLHISIQPIVPKELKVFERGVRKMTMKYPGISVTLEETGLYTLSGVGELQFETALTDLRRYDTKSIVHNSIKLSSFVDKDNAQPYVTFCETVANKRGILAVHPPSRHRGEQLAMTAQQLPEKLRDAIENNYLPLDGDDMMPLFTCLRKEHGWDVLASSRGLVSIGPDRTRGGSNILVDDSIDGDWLDEFESAEAVVEGFKAATLRGPLCDSEVRGVHFKLIESALPFSQHLVQHSRLCAHKAMLGANPRLVEPVFAAEIITQPSHVDRIRRLLESKRGNVVSETKIPASPLVVCKAYCPAIDHFGLETQMRVETNGEAFPTFAFDHWATIDSDPYDATVAIELLTPARGHKIARDFVLKTRMRKGLRPKPEDVDIQ